MRRFVFGAIAVVLTGVALVQPAVVLGQDSVTVVTVCEVLRNPEQYAGKHVAVLGRSESDDSGIIPLFLAEDSCGELARSNRIALDYSDNSTIPIGERSLLFDSASLAQKLSFIRTATELRTRRKEDIYPDGDVLRQFGWRYVKDQWEIAYGRIEMKPGKSALVPVQLVLEDIPEYIDDQNDAVTKTAKTTSPPLETSLCDLIHEPERFNGLIVRVRAEYVWTLTEAVLKDAGCPGAVQFGAYHVLDDLKPERGEYAFVTTTEFNAGNHEHLNWKPIENHNPVGLIRTESYRTFQQYAGKKFVWPDGEGCLDCPLFRVFVTATGRFDYFPTQTVAVRAGANAKPFMYSAGEHPSAPLLRLVIESVIDVDAKAIDPSVYSKPRRRDITLEEAHNIVLAYSKTTGPTELPGFELVGYNGQSADGFYHFQAIFDNPGGSVNLGFYAVDRKTGDIWNGVICERITSPSVMKLQQAIRKRVLLTDEEYRKIRRPGPMCDDGEKPRIQKTR